MRRSMKPWAVTLALVAVAVVPNAALGQATETLETGRQAISVEPFTTGGGTTIGWWKVRDADTRFGWLFTVGISHDAQSSGDLSASSSRLSLSVGPEVRQYSSVSGRVAPFLFLGGDVGVTIARDDPSVGDANSDWIARLGARGGLGVEFFLLRNLSIDAQIGANARVEYSPVEGGVTAEDGSRWGIDLGTFTSGVGASFYF